MQEINSLLESILPDNACVARVAEQAKNINRSYVNGEISPDERDALLFDLVNTETIIQEMDQQERRILLGQAVKILSMIPIMN
jgi:hypothetical protein